MAVLDLRDFPGGLNLRDSFEMLKPNETPDALNKTLTTRGAARRERLHAGRDACPARPSYLYYSDVSTSGSPASTITSHPARRPLRQLDRRSSAFPSPSESRMVDFAGQAVIGFRPTRAVFIHDPDG